ncbi:MAG: NAD(P)-dependent dehydrogenase (short-subunit alcohol dehydrogenase family) [Polyangiales bacterium]|jgi:NAD(P)-dependent dehydrogenase (short-subunit alcohol dehydrogenase family)
MAVFRKRGHPVIRASRSLVTELGAQGGDLRLDLQDEESVERAAIALREWLQGRHLEAIVITAAVLHDDLVTPEKNLKSIQPAALLRSFSVNAIGPLLVAKHFGTMLGGPRPIFTALSARVGSIGDNGLGGWYGYRASKAALNMFLRNISIELSRRVKGLVVLALHPGTVATDLSAPFAAKSKYTVFSVEESVDHLMNVIDGATPELNGRFFAWDGSKIEW